MKVDRKRVEQFSTAVDAVVRDPAAQPDVSAGDEPLLAAARRVARWTAGVGLDPPTPALQQRVAALGRAAAPPASRPLGQRRPVWAAVALVAALVIALVLTPAGQTALAGFMAVFRLGQTEVRITPSLPVGTGLEATAAPSVPVRQEMTQSQARERMWFAIPEPAYLPPGYRPAGAVSYTYPDLPTWLPQPFSVELLYRNNAGDEILLRAYPITLGDRGTISHLNLEASPIQEVREVDIGGQPGALLRLDPIAGRGNQAWQEVVWELGDLVLSLSAANVSEDDLLRMARTVR